MYHFAASGTPSAAKRCARYYHFLLNGNGVRPDGTVSSGVLAKCANVDDSQAAGPHRRDHHSRRGGSERRRLMRRGWRQGHLELRSDGAHGPEGVVLRNENLSVGLAVILAQLSVLPSSDPAERGESARCPAWPELLTR